jgi:hypothetical protein
MESEVCDEDITRRGTNRNMESEVYDEKCSNIKFVIYE